MYNLRYHAADRYRKRIHALIMRQVRNGRGANILADAIVLVAASAAATGAAGAAQRREAYIECGLAVKRHPGYTYGRWPNSQKSTPPTPATC